GGEEAGAGAHRRRSPERAGASAEHGYLRGAAIWRVLGSDPRDDRRERHSASGHDRRHGDDGGNGLAMAHARVATPGDGAIVAVWRPLKAVAPRLLFFAALVGAWELCVRLTGVRSYLLPAPSGVWGALVTAAPPP